MTAVDERVCEREREGWCVCGSVVCTKNMCTTCTYMNLIICTIFFLFNVSATCFRKFVCRL